MKRCVSSGFVRACGIPIAVLIMCAFAGENQKPLTFLDTLNKGREVSLAPADYGIAETSAPAQRQMSATPDQVVTGGSPFAAKAEQKKEAGVVVSRFRIQVLASTVQDRVKSEKKNLTVKTDLPVTISFEAPYYKLFAGDFSLRDEAENHLARLKNMGYNDAWIVRTAVK